MKTMHALTILTYLVAIVMFSSPASAETDIGIGLSPLVGTHDEGGGPQWVPPVPIPVVEVRHRTGPMEVFFETLPIALPIAHGAGNGLSSTTNLAFFDGAIRVYISGDRAYVGLGELVYNQRTAYSTGQVNSSRVAGGRYEIGTLLLPGRRLRVEFDYAPHMSGSVAQNYPLPGGAVGRISVPESGGQVEANLQYTNPHDATELRYGLRYLNYVEGFPGGMVADHNVGVLPSITFLWHFGSRR